MISTSVRALWSTVSMNTEEEGAPESAETENVRIKTEVNSGQKSADELEAPVQGLLSRFVKSKSPSAEPKKATSEVIRKPAYIEDAAEVLEIEATEKLTVQIVHASWRRLICQPEVHPDLGGNPEKAILINLAKDQLIRWIESSEPKLGKFFQK